MPGARMALRALSSLSVQCVATNATESTGAQVAEALARAGLRDHLTHFFTSGEMGVGKPSPEFFKEVSVRLGLPPEALLAVGNDLAKDIVPAKGIGMKTVLVSAGLDSASAEAADLVVPNLIRLAEIVMVLPGP
jgi:putative hydrolase of the HAD superfamily